MTGLSGVPSKIKATSSMTRCHGPAVSDGELGLGRAESGLVHLCVSTGNVWRARPG